MALSVPLIPDKHQVALCQSFQGHSGLGLPPSCLLGDSRLCHCQGFQGDLFQDCASHHR